MKSAVYTFNHLMQIIWRIPDNTYFLCINHRYDLINRYILYKSVKGEFCEEVNTNSKEEMKMRLNLFGFKIIEKYVIVTNDIHTPKIEFELFELNRT